MGAANCRLASKSMKHGGIIGSISLSMCIVNQLGAMESRRNVLVGVLNLAQNPMCPGHQSQVRYASILPCRAGRQLIGVGACIERIRSSLEGIPSLDNPAHK